MDKKIKTLFTFLIASFSYGVAGTSEYTIPYMDFNEEAYSTTAKPSYSKYITYEDYGAKGNGTDDDAEAIYAAHEAANASNLPVKAKAGKKYLIKKANNKTAIINTDTEWTGAEFIIDDSELSSPKERKQIFSVRDEYSLSPIVLIDNQNAGGSSEYSEIISKGLKKDATSIGTAIPAKSILWLENKDVIRFRRCQSGKATEQPAQEDLIVVDKNGNIDKGTPLNWSYDAFSQLYCKPIKQTTLYLTGGTFTTIVNKCNSTTYVAGGIEVLRSNVVIDKINHKLQNEGTSADYSAPYYGIFYLKQCAYITIKNCTVSSHITYANRSGTYDIFPYEVAYLTLQNCHENTNLCDYSRWGVIGSNFCKNVRIIDSELSRFDAHKGVTHAYIKNSTIGWAGINVIGEGTLMIEDSKCYGSNFVRLREDFGSTWHGNIYVKNCDWYLNRSDGKGISSSMACIIGGNHICKFDFGYDCYMPKKIVIDGFRVHDEAKGRNYYGPYLLNPFIDSSKDVFDSLKDKYPYHLTEDIYFKDYKSTSSEYQHYFGVSSNSDKLFEDVVVHSSWSSSEEK